MPIKYNYEVSVSDNKAKLNKDIFLFRGNRNIHYYFSIKGARFTFSKENENLLESSNAIYAAITVIKPNGVEVANAIAPVEDGLIHLKVTEDLIDEEVEVGDFDLVFDLFDDNEGAVTIPKIKGQFHVQERPCTTSIGTLSGNVNVVNQAVVDLAIATQENEQLIVVDDDGKYVKTTWVKGDKISVERLNKIEEGIEKNSTQYKDIANKTIVEGGKLYLVKSDGTKLDEGTDLPTSSGEKGDPGTSITISSVVESAEDGGNNVVTFSDGSVLNVKNGNKGDSGTGGNSVPVFYKTEFLGELYAQPGGNDYVAWCPGDLRYDKKLDKYVMLAFCADKHGNATVKCIYQIVIDPYTFESTEPVKIKFLDSDGVTDITPTMVGTCCYKILNDGEKDVKCENTKNKNNYIIKKTKSIFKRTVAVQSFFI